MNAGLAVAANFLAGVVVNAKRFFVAVPFEFAFPERRDGSMRGVLFEIKERALLVLEPELRTRIFICAFSVVPPALRILANGYPALQRWLSSVFLRNW
jgi:hypothetical protein